MLLALPLQQRELLTGQQPRAQGDAPARGTHTCPTRRANQASALPPPYVFKERQERREQPQSDGDSRLPVRQAERVAEDSQGRRADVAVAVLQSLRDLWQQALQSRCLHETHHFVLWRSRGLHWQNHAACRGCSAGRAEISLSPGPGLKRSRAANRGSGGSGHHSRHSAFLAKPQQGAARTMPAAQPQAHTLTGPGCPCPPSRVFQTA